MPPHDRLYRRLNGLVRQAAQVTRHHEPLLFLYPRWFATAASPSVETEGEQQKERTTLASSSTDGTHKENLGPKPARQVGSKKIEEDDVDSRPSMKLARKIMSDENMAKKKQDKRKEMRNKYLDSEDWRTPLQKLMEHTPKGASEHVRQRERLKIPDGMVGYYESSLDALFLELYLTTDCHVQISRGGQPDSAKGRFHSLVLLGTPTTIKAAKRRLGDIITVKSVAGQHIDGTMGQYQTTSTNVSPAIVRAVWAHTYGRNLAKPVEQIPMPEEWSIISFANFVMDIVTSNPPRFVRQSAYSPSENDKARRTHVDAIAYTLVDLFTNPSMVPHVSTAATTAALSYLTHHRKIPETRSIIEALDTMSFTFTTRIFNVCMRSASHASDLHNYTFILDLMLSRDCIPDWGTWNALLALVHERSPSGKRLVLQAMRSKGLLANPQAKIAVAATLVKTDFANWVARGGDTEAFIEHYDTRMGGKEWLDVSVANRMLAVRAARGQFIDALSIIPVLQARSKRPNNVSLATLSNEAANQDNLPAVLLCFRKIMNANYRIRIEESIYPTLFRMAIRRKDYNLLRVIWRYACMQGSVSWEMKEIVEKAIIWYAPQPDTTLPNSVATISSEESYAESRLQVFKKFAFKAMLGLEASWDAIEMGLTTRDTQAQKLELREKLISTALQPKPDIDAAAADENAAAEQEQMERKRFLRGLVESDIGQYGKLRPRYSLAVMLGYAAEKDREWSRLHDTRKNPDFRWIMENALEVPVWPASRRESDCVESKEG